MYQTNPLVMRKSKAFACVIAALAFGVSVASAADGNVADAKAQLRKAIDEAGKHAEQEYTIASWNEMRFALNRADAIVKQQDVGLDEVADAQSKLRNGIAKLEKRAILPDTNPQLGLSASLFVIDPAGPLNNVALQWAAVEPYERVEVLRASKEAGPFEKIYAGAGASFNDYGLPEGTHFYRLAVRRGGRTFNSRVVSISTMPMPAGLKTYSNQVQNEEGLSGKSLKAGDTFYRFETQREGTGIKTLQHTSRDGKTWEAGPVVLEASSHPDLADCKFEAVTIFYDEVNQQFVWWCHWERAKGYAHGRAFVATAKPGEPFKVHHVYNPLGVQVRDMSVFVDDDGQGYLVAASNLPGQGANATLYIFKLNKTNDDVIEIVAKVAENGYREAPHILKSGGFYYLFFSQAAGWYPSRGGYASARSLQGRWSELRPIGNASTFSAQSGHILEYGNADQHLPVMMGNRWVRGDGTNRNVALPLRLVDGFAFYDYAPFLLHDPGKNIIVPLQLGQLVSQDKPAEASLPPNASQEAAKAFDGDYDTFYRSDTKKWPFTLTTDLGAVHDVRNVQISWFLHKGSEAFYTYTIEGSVDGQQWKTLMDRTNAQDAVLSKTYGFTSDILAEPASARHVRINVQRAHLHNNPNNWYPPTVYEVKVFGKRQ